MARKPTTRKASGKKASPRKTRISDPVEAALSLAATIGWKHVTTEALAEETGLSLADLYRRYPSRMAILQDFASRVDEAMLANVPKAVTGDSTRDRLFAVIMARFDYLQPRKAAISSILRAIPEDPLPVLCGGLPALARMAAWVLEAAGLSSNGIVGALRMKVVGLLYLDIVRVWLRDESADMAKTMAALDKRLERLEAFANFMAEKADRPFFRRGKTA